MSSKVVLLRDVSATSSNKSKLMLFLMVVVSLAFLVTSFLAAALTNDSSSSSKTLQPQGSVSSTDQGPFSSQVPATTSQTGDSSVNYNGVHGNCFIFRTPDAKIFGECTRP